MRVDDRLEQAAAETRQLIEANARLRMVRLKGNLDPEEVAAQLEETARQCDSAMHEVAALVIRRLMKAR